ncbi:MAG: hypothetical protein RLZZ569_756 [Bacteroidota bacterium]|jgi:hypothetical protein
MKKHLTRLTPNFNKWEKPSGREGKCGLDLGVPYEGKNGFGWEEWFLNDYHNSSNQLAGYCYGFIQAFHKKNKAQEKIDRLYLYTKVCSNKTKMNYYLGYINNVEVLKYPFTQRDLINKKNSFCKQADTDLKNLQNHSSQKDLIEMCSEDTVFNVRFKSDDVHIKNFDFLKRPIKMNQGQARFGLYDLEKHTNLLSEINNTRI